MSRSSRHNERDQEARPRRRPAEPGGVRPRLERLGRRGSNVWRCCRPD